MSADERIGIIAALDDVLALCDADAGSWRPDGFTDRQADALWVELQRIAGELRVRRARLVNV